VEITDDFYELTGHDKRESTTNHVAILEKHSLRVVWSRSPEGEHLEKRENQGNRAQNRVQLGPEPTVNMDPNQNHASHCAEECNQHEGLMKLRTKV
jgi:hypothetical protein